ncbi:N-acetylneuraminate 9-O-acetyltransferase-like [Daphnia carinata]|uniref:N-acetylneuraminate 9-O-acetyltransferase-like n=1 Tax=Daphnia carinata TaxID=120202 RepID=UPI00286965D4|nr:N-acetylneuraminate 9-O-acetyltransferase-like [Daphnia carinata]
MSDDRWNQFRPWVLFIGCCFLFGLLLLVIFVFSVPSRRRNERHESHRDGGIATRTEEWPLCVGNRLVNKGSHYEKESAGNRLKSKTTPCRVQQYKTEQVVACLDELNDLENVIGNRSRELHFAFIGDSRTRQQFFNFVRLIPQYDKTSSPIIIPENYHNDVEVSSVLLNIRVSFKWRPLVSDDVTEEIRRWVNSNETDRPYLIFLGMAVWHMLQSEGADYQLYRKKLLNLAPVLDQLANESQIIWLNQYPSVDFNKEIGVFKTDGITSEKIHGYNEVARRLFENHSNVRVWDTSNLFAEEYVRACAVLERDEQSSPLRRCPSVQYNCNDFLHTGDVALSQATQLLVNDICNVFDLNREAGV